MRTPSFTSGFPPFASALILMLALASSLAGCSTRSDGEEPGFFEKIFSKETYKLYRIDIQQGNTIDRKKLAKLKIGMSKEQVRYLLGNPVSENVFHKNRWYYSYYLIPGKGEMKKYRLRLLFDGDRLRDVRGSKELTRSSNKEQRRLPQTPTS